MVKTWWNKTVCKDEYLIDEEIRSSKDDTRQQGGVCTIINNDIITHVSAQGGDTRKLGRWRWITIRGKGNVNNTVITCYCPGNGWITQDNQLAAIRATEEGKLQLLQVSKLWFDDLEDTIRDHKSKGIKIMLAGDFNDNIRKASGKVRQWATGLREVILEKYGHKNAPATHARGSNPIEGFFCTDDINITKGGYVDRILSPGDHSAIYIDVKAKQLIGRPKERTTKPVTTRINSKIPSIRNKFREHIEYEVKRLDLHSKTLKLKDECDRLRANREPITEEVK